MRNIKRGGKKKPLFDINQKEVIFNEKYLDIWS